MSWTGERGARATRHIAIAGLLARVATGCGDPSHSNADADGTAGGFGSTGDDTTGASNPSPSESSAEASGPDPDLGEASGDVPDGPPIDCAPAWATPWIGSPCASKADCAFEGGECLRDADGFPCGTCTQPCTGLCPDLADTPVTYCLNGTDLALEDAGYFLSQCAQEIVGADGCRDGYVCTVLGRFDGSGTQDVCSPEEFAPDDAMYVNEIDHEFLIEHLGGNPVDPLDSDNDLEGLQMYLDAVGVVHNSAAEIVEPHDPQAAEGCGLAILLPDNDLWEKIGALGLFADRLVDLVGEPVYMRNWWRPPCYNDAVGGAPAGDHPDGDAIDLDFGSPTARAIAQEFLCTNYWKQDILMPGQIMPGSDIDPRLNMSIGLGGVTIHLGVLSEGGRRFWHYDSYSAEPGSGDCW